MNRVQLRQIIKEVVVRKLRELDMNKPGVTSNSEPDASNLTDAEQKKLKKLQQQAADLNAHKQELEGRKADLEGRIQPSIQQIERAVGPIDKRLGNVRHEIEKIKDKA